MTFKREQKELCSKEIESMEKAVEEGDIRAIHPDKMEDWAEHLVRKLKSQYNYPTYVFFMKFIVYSKEGCPHCYKVKTVLELCGMDCTVYELGEDYTKQEFFDKFGEGSTFPRVICDDELLGGARETISYLRDKSLV